MWTSQYEPVDVGGTTLDRLVLDAAERAGERPALIAGETGEVVSYARLAGRIASVAGTLGGSRGETLALWAPNGPAWPAVAFGAMAAGMTVTAASPACTERELAAQLADSGATIVATEPDRLRAARAAGAPEAVAIADLEAPAAVPVSRPDDLALLPYSSGTTGLPKGVMLTHVQLVTAVRQVRAAIRPGPGDSLLAVAPFFHVLGFAVVLGGGLSAGATLVTMARFDLERMLALIERHRVTMLIGAPPLLRALAEHPRADRHDLSSLELLLAGGAPLPPDVQAAVERRLPHAVVGQGWGMTETTVGAAVPDRERGSLPASVGRALPNTSLRVVDPVSGRDLGPGEDGELCVSGPQLMAGYRNRPDATAAMIDPDGWLHTGDLGHVDADGNVFIVDRLKELIKVSGYQVAPAELEALLLTHPAVADAAVIGRPDERRGEVPVAVVVPRGKLDAGALMLWVAARVAPYKRLREVRVAQALPRSPAGKLLRRVLVEQDRAATCKTDCAAPTLIAL
jgi:acyl-CoA synthetase (AMP-forming)/AMP-acid ligase II